MKVISDSTHVIRVALLGRKQYVKSSPYPLVAHEISSHPRPDITQVHCSHGRDGIKYRAYSNSIMRASLQWVRALIDEMDSEIKELLGQHCHHHAIMAVHGFLRVLAFPSMCYSYVEPMENRFNKIPCGKELLGLVVVWGPEDCIALRETGIGRRTQFRLQFFGRTIV